MKKRYIIMLFGALLLNSCTIKLYDVYYDPTMNNKKTIRTIDNLEVIQQQSKDIVSYRIQGNYYEQLPIYNDTIIKKTVKSKYNFGIDMFGFFIGLPAIVAISPLLIPFATKKDCSYTEEIRGKFDDPEIINSRTLIRYDVKCENFLSLYRDALPFITGIGVTNFLGSSSTKSKFENVKLDLIAPNINKNKMKSLGASEIPVELHLNNSLVEKGNCSTNFLINLKEEAIKAYGKSSTIEVCLKVVPNNEIVKCKNEFCYSFKTEDFLPPQTSITDKIIVTPSDAILFVGTEKDKLTKSNSSLFIEKSAFDFSPKLPAKYIKVVRDGYKTWEKYLEATDKDRTTEIILEEVQTGYLKLTSTEDNVEILIDGEYQGLLSKSIPLNKKIEVGSHLITAKKKYFLTNTIKAEIEFKQVFSHNFKLVKADSNWDEDATKSNILQAQGSLTVVTERKDLVVYIDGVKRVPSFEFNNIAAGEYDMRVVGKGVDKIIHIVIEDKSRVFIDLDEELKK